MTQRVKDSIEYLVALGYNREVVTRILMRNVK